MAGLFPTISIGEPGLCNSILRLVFIFKECRKIVEINVFTFSPEHLMDSDLFLETGLVCVSFKIGH